MHQTPSDGAKGGRPNPLGVGRDLLYRSLFEHALLEVHIWELVRDAEGRIVTWRLVDANGAALKSWKRRLDEVVGKTTEEIFPGADSVATFMSIVEEITRTGRPKEWEVNFEGTAQILHMMIIPVGEYFVSTGFDVTRERKQRRELQEALQSLTRATQAGGVGLWDWNLRTHKVRYSDEWKHQLGYAPDEIDDAFEEWRSRVHPDDLEPTLAQVQARLDAPDHKYEVVFRMRHKDGSWRWILAQASLLLDEAGAPERMLGSHVDITERRRLEEQVIASQKLESLGTLAAGIAHDFNNLLGAITGNLSLLRDATPSDPQVPTLLRELDEAARRASALTYQLLTFAKGGSPVRDVTGVRELVIDAATFVSRGSNVQCVFGLDAALAPVEADVGQLSQVIDNLVINAMQAMPEGGTIRIEGANVALTDDNPTGLRAGPYVRISVADEGTGIPPEVLPRIFDPFFTTKSTGSGLGLSSAYAIVGRHGGRITVQTTVGRGTVFDVWLPASKAAPRVAPRAAVVPGAGRILLMDDDGGIRRVFHRMLTRLGYACDECANGEEALSFYDAALRAGRAYDAVILDLTIPGHRGGAEVLATLRELDPNVVAIVTSGYAESDVLARFEAYGFRGRLQKPATLAAVSAELARVFG